MLFHCGSEAKDSVLLNSGENIFLDFVAKCKVQGEGSSSERDWADFSQKWFTLLPSTRPFMLQDFGDLADHVS